MKSLKTILAFLTLVIFISCGSSDNEDTKAPETQTPSSTTAPAPQTSENPANPANTQTITLPQGNTNPQPAVQSPNIQTITPVEAKPAAPANTNKKLNPPHGQPGHRCDIAVGAPLDGTSSINNKTSTTTQPLAITPTLNSQPTVVTPTAVPANENKTAATNLKLNPAHGQPGHQCGIAVGAPLDGSATAKTEIKTAPNKNPLEYFQPIPKVETNKTANVQPKEAVKN